MGQHYVETDHIDKVPADKTYDDLFITLSLFRMKDGQKKELLHSSIPVRPSKNRWINLEFAETTWTYRCETGVIFISNRDIVLR